MLLSSRSTLKLNFSGGECVNWEEWWTYDGISGPQFWGVINPEWRLCNEGRRQSPVDIDTRNMLYDPGLADLHVSDVTVGKARLTNTGHGLFLALAGGNASVMISRGPLLYTYKAYAVSIHFGQRDGTKDGSEHTINGHSFVGEVKILFSSQHFLTGQRIL